MAYSSSDNRRRLGETCPVNSLLNLLRTIAQAYLLCKVVIAIQYIGCNEIYRPRCSMPQVIYNLYLMQYLLLLI